MGQVDELKALKHKDCDLNDWDKVSPSLRVLGYELVDYCKVHSLPITITSIIRPMIPGISKTDIHGKGRAFDVSVRGWTNAQAIECEEYLNENFSESLGAISIETGRPRACLYHGGTGLHLHIQCRPSN